MTSSILWFAISKHKCHVTMSQPVNTVETLLGLKRVVSTLPSSRCFVCPLWGNIIECSWSIYIKIVWSRLVIVQIALWWCLECCSHDNYFRSMSCIWHHVISLSATPVIPWCSARRVGWSGSGIYVWAVRFFHGDDTVKGRHGAKALTLCPKNWWPPNGSTTISRPLLTFGYYYTTIILK